MDSFTGQSSSDHSSVGLAALAERRQAKFRRPASRESSIESRTPSMTRHGLCDHVVRPYGSAAIHLEPLQMPFPRASQALSRFTVLDLTRVRSGPTCVRQLADWGANVIKIDALMEDAGGERPGGPRQGSALQTLHR